MSGRCEIEETKIDRDIHPSFSLTSPPCPWRFSDLGGEYMVTSDIRGTPNEVLDVLLEVSLLCMS